MEIKRIFTEGELCPMAVETDSPVFAWELASEKPNAFQKSYRLRVCEEGCADALWDSGTMLSGVSTGVPFGGKGLKPCTAYKVCLEVQDLDGAAAHGETRFETGLMDPHIAAWEGAQWIAAPRHTVAAYTKGVFKIETCLRMGEGCRRAGLVFGAGDYRLEDGHFNLYSLEGDNYIRYEIDLQDENSPKLVIYRVGYAPGDSGDVPFAQVDLGQDFAFLNDGGFHKLSVEVEGNCAITYIDGILADFVLAADGRTVGRQLNPLGDNDVITFPRLNRIGFFAAEGGKAYFENIAVSNLRAPSAVVVDERPEGGLYGRASVFAPYMGGALGCEEGCFTISGGQVTADPSNTSIPMLRRVFRVREGLKKARLYATARGIYELQLNGGVVEGSLLAPGYTQFDKRLQYQVYDVTDSLQTGENGIGAVLASGWWSDAQTFTVKNYNYFGDKEALLCKIVLEYEDGGRETVVSDPESWQYFGGGPYVYAGNFVGEQYDARLGDIYRDFTKPGFDAAGWERPVSYSPAPIPAVDVGFARLWPAVNETEPEIVGGYCASVSVVAQRQAESCRKSREGSCIYDFGQEVAGVPRITFREKRGTKILIRYSEMLYPDLPKYGGKVGQLMRENYRDAESADIYICRGDEEGETYRPRFTFHGFRYLEVCGVTQPPQLQEVEALQYSSLTEYMGSFRCSHELLNRFVENVKWSQLCNFINIPTDCPQRNERMGWAGDTHLFCGTALRNTNFKEFYERNLQAFADLQEDCGRYPDIAPVGGGFGGITYQCATIFIAWELYLQYGDRRLLRRRYSGMNRFMDFLAGEGMPSLQPTEKIGPLTDWLSVEETDPALMWNAFYYRAANTMASVARVLGEAEDELRYTVLAETVRAFWNKHFADEKTGLTYCADGSLCDTQCSYAMALEYGLSRCREKMEANLARKVRANGHRIATGFFGTGLLCPALTAGGYVEDAYKMLLQTDNPSWLYSVTQGATTIWECWDAYTKENGFTGFNSRCSFNHYSFGSVLNWIYNEILGVQRLFEYPGYTRFVLKPRFDVFSFAGGSVASPYGKIESRWEKKDGKVVYTCVIPVNTCAVLVLEGRAPKELGSGEHSFELPWRG